MSAAINVSPATPLPTPMSSPEGVNVLPVIKRDLVVRFTDKQNSVRCEMANKGQGNGNNSDTNHSATPSTVTPLKFKDQYELQHVMSPDSENSVCNRSRENLLSTPGKIIKEVKLVVCRITDQVKWLEVSSMLFQTWKTMFVNST